MDYPKSVPNVGLVDGQFADENPATGQVGSLIPSAWGNAVTQELLNVIKAAGFAPAEGQTNQLLKAIQGLVSQGIKNSVRVATTGAIALSGVQTIDAIVLVAGDRVLVKNQASGAQNGIYVVAAGAWVRALDADESVEVKPGMLVGVDAGTVNGGSVWRLSNATPPTLGTTALTFEQVFGKTGVVAGSYKSVTVGADGRVTGGTNPTTLSGYGITDAYTKAQVDTELSGKANVATTLGGYGISDAYTKTEADSRYLRAANNLSDLPNKATARTNLELGTAATANLTTSSTDTTSGRALKVADFGLGGSPAADTADPDALQFSCFFRAFDSAKMPTVATYSGIHIQREPGNARAAQIIWSDAPFEQYSRVRSGSGVWSAWSKPYSNTNTSSFIQALLDDPDQATARATLGITDSLGHNQAWQNLTASRAANTTYTNSTGRTITVLITVSTGNTTQYYLNGSNIATSAIVNGGKPSITIIVPPGATYSIGPTTIDKWWELR